MMSTLKSKRIETEKLIIADGDGRARIEFSIGKDGGACLELKDSTGQTRATLGLNPKGPGELSLTNRSGEKVASLGLQDDSPVLSLYDSKGKLRVTLGVKDNPQLEMFTPSGAKLCGFP